MIDKGGYLKNKPTLLNSGPGIGKTILPLFFAFSPLLRGERQLLQVFEWTRQQKFEGIIL